MIDIHHVTKSSQQLQDKATISNPFYGWENGGSVRCMTCPSFWFPHRTASLSAPLFELRGEQCPLHTGCGGPQTWGRVLTLLLPATTSDKHFLRVSFPRLQDNNNTSGAGLSWVFNRRAYVWSAQHSRWHLQSCNLCHGCGCTQTLNTKKAGNKLLSSPHPLFWLQNGEKHMQKEMEFLRSKSPQPQPGGRPGKQKATQERKKTKSIIA